MVKKMSRFGDLIAGKTTPEPVVAAEPVVKEVPKKKPKKAAKIEETKSWDGPIAPKKLQF